jgi:restriction endonuclease S subunit
LGRGSAQSSISYSKIKDIAISLPTYKQQVELSEWFENMQEHKNNLLKSLQLQGKMFSQLTDYSIVSNCIK